jgi:hypothetical protein
MLESIREFAAEMLETSGDAGLTSSTHAAVFLALAEDATPHLHGADQRHWLDRLERDHDNLRAALAWTTARTDATDAVRLVYALWRFWQQRGYLDEARRLLDGLAERVPELSPELRARFAETAGGVAYWQADIPAAVHWYDVALEVRRELADVTDPATQRELANALYNRGYAGVALVMRATGTDTRPDPAAREMMEEALAIYTDLDDAVGEGNLLWGLGGYLIFAGEPAPAEEYFRRSFELHRAAGQRTMEAWSLHMLSTALVMQGHMPDAGEASRHALRHFHASGDVSGITLALDVQASVAIAADERRRGGRLWGAARQLQRASGTGLAEWDEGILAETPFGVRKAMSPGELDTAAAEGASLSLGEAVAYALGEADPFDAS